MKHWVLCCAVVFGILSTEICVYAFNVPQIEGYDIFSNTANQIVSGSFALNPIDVFKNILSMFTIEIRAFSGVAAALLVMVLLSSTIGTLNSAFGTKGAPQTAFFVFFSVISGLALMCFRSALDYGTDVIFNMTSFMSKFTPIIIMILFAANKTASAMAFEPVLSAAVFVVSYLIEKCIVPLIVFTAVLSIAGNIGEKNRIQGFVKIVRSVTKWIIALILTVFTGINTIYGFTASSLDAVGAKTIKFAVGSLVPVVGSFLSDTLDTVAASAGVMKNAIGVSGVVVISALCLTPIIKIGIMQIILKLIAAVTEPITDSRISKVIWDISESITSVFGVVVLTAVMFLINICIILRATA